MQALPWARTRLLCDAVVKPVQQSKDENSFSAARLSADYGGMEVLWEKCVANITASRFACELLRREACV